MTTGWNLKGDAKDEKRVNKYTMSVDNIMSTAARSGDTETWHKSGKLLPVNKQKDFFYSNNTSDHSPVAAMFDL